MVSQVLAQAILNQKAPDVVGEFMKGQEIAKGRKTEQLAGQVLRGESSLDELLEVNPEVALALGETIRARSAKDINDFIRDAKITQGMLQRGDTDSARSFVQQRRNSIAMRGGDTTQTDQVLGLLASGRDGEALEMVSAFTSALDQTKEKPAGQQEIEFQASALKGAINPSTGKPFTREEAMQEILLRKTGITARAGISAQERIAQDPSLTMDVARSQAAITGATAGATESAKLRVQARDKPQIEAAIQFAKESAKNAAASEKVERGNVKALSVYDAALEGLISSFEEAGTGAIKGLLPAIADDDRVLEGAIKIMEPVLKGVVREAGEGTFSDGDRKQIEELMPSRRDNKEVAKRKIKLLDTFVRSKLDAQKSEPQPAAELGGIKFLGFE